MEESGYDVQKDLHLRFDGVCDSHDRSGARPSRTEPAQIRRRKGCGEVRRVLAGRPLFWTAETFPTWLRPRRRSESSASLSISAARPGCLTLGPENAAGNGGEVVASVGPIDAFEAPEYMLRINTSLAPPGTKTSIHSHPGSEAIHVLSGEVTVRWPDRTEVIAAGNSQAGQPPHTAMEATSTGDEDLVELIMFVVDPSQEFGPPAVLD